MTKKRRYKKSDMDRAISKQPSSISSSYLHLEKNTSAKEDEILKPGTKVKLAWRVTYKKK